MSSIRRFLLSGTLGVVAAIALTTSALSYYSARHEIEEIYDANLVQYARLLQGLLARGNIDPGDLPRYRSVAPNRDDADSENQEEVFERNPALIARYGHWYERNFAFQLWDVQHTLQFSNIDELQNALGAFQVGLSDVDLNGHAWRVFTQFDAAREQWLFAGERLTVRDELVAEIALNSIMPGLVTLPVILALVYWLVGRGLAPLLRMAGAIGEKAPGNLQQIDLGELPAELAPLNAAINRLLARLESALRREQQLTADAAHELRTPLAVLRVHAQNALNADNEAARSKALNSLVMGVDRTTHLVGQLLSLARAGHGDEMVREPVDFTAVIREEVAELIPLAMPRHQELCFDTDEHNSIVCGDNTGLRALVRNLVDNAIRYTPEGGHITVSLVRLGNQLRLRVADSGPGIPESLRERVFDSFYRPAENDGEGAGLGLSIVQRVADRHSARVGMSRGEAAGEFHIDVTFTADR